MVLFFKFAKKKTNRAGEPLNMVGVKKPINLLFLKSCISWKAIVLFTLTSNPIQSKFNLKRHRIAFWQSCFHSKTQISNFISAFPTSLSNSIVHCLMYYYIFTIIDSFDWPCHLWLSSVNILGLHYKFIFYIYIQ